MTRDEVLARLETARAGFDRRVAAVPADRLTAQIPGSVHSVRDIVVHVSAYDDLIVQRLVSARHGAATAFDRDREGWQAFNERVWAEAERIAPDAAIRRAEEVFSALVHEVGQLTDEELRAPVGSTAALDPAWLEGRAPWELIAIDAYEHYPMHYAALEGAAAEDREDS